MLCIISSSSNAFAFFGFERSNSTIKRNQNNQQKIQDLKKILRRANVISYHLCHKFFSCERLFDLVDLNEDQEIDEEAFLDLMGKLGLDIMENGLVLMFEMYSSSCLNMKKAID